MLTLDLLLLSIPVGPNILKNVYLAKIYTNIIPKKLKMKIRFKPPLVSQ